ncbi:unnamed protein product [Diamesa serratosioi]
MTLLHSKFVDAVEQVSSSNSNEPWVSMLLVTLLVSLAGIQTISADGSCVYKFDEFRPDFYFCDLTGASYVDPACDNNIGDGVHLKDKQDKDITYVAVFTSTFKYIPTAVFDKYKNLDSFHLYNVSPLTLNDQSFKNCDKLTDIHMDQNKITKLPAGTFKECKNLEEIRIVNNEISEIADDAFLGLSKLKTLSLTSNKLVILHLAPFLNLPNLADLSIGYNEITAVTPKFFESLPNLKRIFALANKCVDMEVFEVKNIATEVTSKYDKCFKNYESLKN